MSIVVWIGFVLFVLVLLALDLGVFHREARAPSTGEALGWTAVWIALAMLFNVGVWWMVDHHWLGMGTGPHATADGAEAAMEFLTAYVVEKSLSLDNIFVIAMIFATFRIPAANQHRVLFWGILGALVLRGAMIAGGLALIDAFDWIVYVFGALLLYTAARMLVVRHDSAGPDQSAWVGLVKRVVPVTDTLHGERFLVRQDGRWHATPLLLALVMVEGTDVLFAVDSIPAVFGVTTDPFLVFTSNVFAILGLRSLYFALASVMDRFRYLKQSLVFVLAFVGVKMLLAHHHPIPPVVSLATILGMLAVGVFASVVSGASDTAPLASPIEPSRRRELLVLTWRHAGGVVVLALAAVVLSLIAVLLLLPVVRAIHLGGAGGVFAVSGVVALLWYRHAKARLADLGAHVGTHHDPV